MIIYPILYQDSVDLEGDNDNIVTLLTPPEQRMLQSILNSVESNPDVYIEDYFDQDTDEIDAFLAELMLKLMGDTVAEIVPTRRQRLFADGYNALVGAFTWSTNTSQSGGGFWLLANAVNNLVRWDYISLKRGIYQVEFMGVRNPAHGIISLKFNGTIETTIDLYVAGATQFNQKLLSGSFQIDEDGVYTVAAQMVTKNASSTGFSMGLSWLDIYRISEL